LQLKSLNIANKKASKTDSLTKKRILWWKPTSGDTALHKEADFEIIRQLSTRGFFVTVVVPTSKGKIPNLDTNSTIRTIQIRMKSLPFILPVARSILLSFLLPICVAKFQPNFVITEPDVSILSFIPTIVISKIKKIKFVLDIRSVPVETFGFLGFLMNLWFNFSVLLARKYFDGLTAITSLMKAELCRRYKINPQKVGVWTSGVSLGLFNSSKNPSEILELRDKLGLSSKFVVFYHGIFSPTRGLKQSVEAIEKLKHAYPSIALFLLGAGPIVPDLQKLIREGGLEKNVIIHKPVDQGNVPIFIEMCDVAILPLPNNLFWRYQSPLKLLEYLAMKKVVILTKIPAHTSIVGESKSGLYVSSIEPAELASAIEYAYANKSNLASWGKMGRVIAKEYQWEKVAEDLEDFLLSVAA
jgi:glycosyltransferase involved in cell wall biosynthesis